MKAVLNRWMVGWEEQRSTLLLLHNTHTLSLKAVFGISFLASKYILE